MSQYLALGVNSIAYGGLLFLLSAGFSLIFGLMRIPNLMHGSFFMLGAYLGVSILEKGVRFGGTIFAQGINLFGATFFEHGITLPLIVLLNPKPNFFVAALISGLAMAVIGGLIERLLLRRLAGQELPQVLLTLGLSFI